MQSIIQKIKGQFALSLFALFAVVVMAAPQAHAITSAQATVHNAVTVTYSAGVSTLTATATVDVTVLTKAAAPNITSPTGATVLAGDIYSYVYTVVSTANGPDTYTPTTAPTVTDATMAGSSVAPDASITLWGGIALGSGLDTITVPAGSEGGLTAGAPGVGTIVQIGANQYTVTAIAGVGGNPIAIATTDPTTGITTAENSAVLTLAPIGAAPGITAGSVVAGTQVGEVGEYTVILTAGTPTTPGVDGTATIPAFTLVTTATGPAIAGVAGTPATSVSTTPVATTVSSPAVTITKASRNISVDPVGVFVTNSQAVPGEILEYKITVTNTHATASATSVSISDIIPTYTDLLLNAYGAGIDVVVTTTVGGIPTVVNTTAILDADVTTLAGGATTGTLTVNLGAGAIAGAGGTLAAGDSVVITYQVTLQ